MKQDAQDFPKTSNFPFRIENCEHECELIL